MTPEEKLELWLEFKRRAVYVCSHPAWNAPGHQRVANEIAACIELLELPIESEKPQDTVQTITESLERIRAKAQEVDSRENPGREDWYP